MEQQPKVELRGVHAGYDSEVLHDITLTVSAGELVCLLGPNGAGKSTLLKVVSGSLAIRTGSVTVCGQDIAAMTRQTHAGLVAVVAQRSELAPGFTVRDVVAMGRAPHQGAWLRSTQQDEALVDDSISTCSLSALAERSLTELSGGELSRVHLARALCQQTPVLLLDEVGAHLDVRHAVAAYALVRQQVAERNLACIAVVHDLNAAARYADRVVLMREGKLVADGTPRAVMTAARLAEVYQTDIVTAEAQDGNPYFVARAAG